MKPELRSDQKNNRFSTGFKPEKRKDMVKMKSTKTMIITGALAAVMIAGSAVTAFAAESSSVPEESSSSVSQTQEQTEEKRQKPEKKAKKGTEDSNSSTESGNSSEKVKHRRKRSFKKSTEPLKMVQLLNQNEKRYLQQREHLRTTQKKSENTSVTVWE